jgi:hypothetical protein
MKKFFLTLIFLLIIGGTVFFFGWAQLSVPPGSYGVIISKTHGVDPVPVQSGEFRWVWYKLIPTNVIIPVFSIKPERFPIEFNSSLPSGDVYSSFVGLGGDFSWNLNAVVSFSLDPEKLVQFVSRHNITDQEGLDAHLQDIAQSIEVFILRLLSSGELDTSRIERLLSGRPDEEMEREISSQFPEIRNFSFSIQSARFPDFILYTQVRMIYEEFLAKQREYITSAFGIKAESHIESQLRFDELERYGDLLTRYPVLLEYLLLEGDNTNQ